MEGQYGSEAPLPTAQTVAQGSTHVRVQPAPDVDILGEVMLLLVPNLFSPAAPLKLESSPVLSQGRKVKGDDHRSRPGRPAVSGRLGEWHVGAGEGGPQLRSSCVGKGPPCRKVAGQGGGPADLLEKNCGGVEPSIRRKWGGGRDGAAHLVSCCRARQGPGAAGSWPAGGGTERPRNSSLIFSSFFPPA